MSQRLSSRPRYDASRFKPHPGIDDWWAKQKTRPAAPRRPDVPSAEQLPLPVDLPIGSRDAWRAKLADEVRQGRRA